MTEPKEQAVPVVGVEEAVERLSRLANDASQVEFDENGYLNPDDTDAIRTILQALKGSSLRDTHRATEGAVVGVVKALEAEAAQLLAASNDSKAKAGERKQYAYLYAGVRRALKIAQAVQNKNRKLGGDEAEGGVNHLQSQLKAAYEALIWLGARRNLELSYGYEDEEDGGWQVHEVRGGRNDREWTLLATAATPTEVITEARQALARRVEPNTERKGGE